MIDNIITAYLRNNKRLVVPEFGAFIHKDDGEVVFVEFLKKDDGALSGLLRREYSVDDTEARGIIDEYVFNIRRTVGATGKYAIEGLGTLRTDANGLYALVYDPRVRKEHVEFHHTPVEEQAPEPDEPVMRVVTREIEVDAPAPSVSDDIIMAARVADAEEEVRSDNIIEFAFPARNPAPAPEPPKQEEKKAFTLNDLYSIPADDKRQSEPRRPEPAAQPAQSKWVSAEEEPRSGQRTEGGKWQPERPGGQRMSGPRPQGQQTGNMRQPEGRPRPQASMQRPQRRPVNHRRGGGRSKADWVMIIAIAVALFALGTMIYGMFIKSNPSIKSTQDQIENVDNGADVTDGEKDAKLPDNER